MHAILICWKFPNTITELLWEDVSMVWQDSALYQSTKDGDSTIHPNERFKGPERANTLWIYTADDYPGQIPWTYSGQRIDLEGTVENVMNKVYSNFGTVRAYLVKPGVWNPGRRTGSTSCWSDLYWPTAPSFGYCGSENNVNRTELIKL